MNKKLLIIIPIIIILIGGLIFAGVKMSQSKNEYTGNKTTATAENNKENNEINKENEVEDDEKNMYNTGLHYATIVVKNYGTIKLELDANIAPITVANFIKLVNEGFYDGLTFHRIMDGFMIQGGAPYGNRNGVSLQNIKGEFLLNGVNNNISHVRGVVSMARASDYNSASSQFFIVHEDSLFLDGQYAGFGKVIEGIEIVDEICKDTPVIDDNGTVLKNYQPIIEKITMEN